ncbi:hypothetical protein Afe04nite_60990 [Asanoa ferruginea]|uniref:FAD-dependent oxidoreductase n=1 Tax=Asanoa ferruginea TaxID=53367 RepID=UPI001945510D|nr:FAD-dependent oxidoreductase [Asanoa ferruginea]GIF51560.1 hypothetical protein Afe04nite_60990 [Asanoa ferruginea]
MHAIVIGGGVAGTVSAIALRRQGAEVTLFEAHPDPGGEVGSFVSLAVNGLRGLAAIDCLERVQSRGMPIARMRMWSAKGQLIADVPRGRRTTDPMRSITLMRGHLVAELRAAAEEAGVRLVTGERLVAVDPDGTARFASGLTATGDLLVGADGIRSVVRGALDPDAPTPRYAGVWVISGRSPGAVAGPSARDSSPRSVGEVGASVVPVPGDGSGRSVGEVGASVVPVGGDGSGRSVGEVGASVVPVPGVAGRSVGDFGVPVVPVAGDGSGWSVGEVGASAAPVPGVASRRAVDEVSGASPGEGTFNMTVGAHGAFVHVVPPSGGEVWWQAQVNSPNPPGERGGEWLLWLDGLFAAEPVPRRIIAATTQLHRHSVNQVLDLVRVWHDARIVLVGDAAHPVGAGQGASMAIEDGVVLGAMIGAAGTVHDGLARYEAARRERVTRVLRAADDNREAKQAGPVRRRLTEIGMSLFFERFYERATGWLYDYEPVPTLKS